MHSYKSKNGTIFNFNGDFSGHVWITDSNGVQFDISGDDILEFVAYNKILPDRISALEDADWKELIR